MPENAASAMKARLRADLRAAMTNRRTVDAKVIRSLIAALDNAEAPPVATGQASLTQHQFREGSAEVERLLLGQSQVREILLAEIQEREHAAAELDRIDRSDRAEELRAEIAVAQRYVD